MDLNTRARTAAERVAGGTDTPPWWPALQVVLGVGFAIYLVFAFGSGSSSAPHDPLVAAPSVDPAPDDQPADVPADDGPDDNGAADGGELVTLPVEGGGTHDVPADAVANARAYALGLFTGNFDDVVFTETTSVPQVPATAAAPEAGEATVLDVTDTSLRLSFPVDPDPDGPSPVRNVPVTVVAVGGDWAVSGG